ncbi:histidine triad protein HinT [Mycoplasmopsis columbina]|uniref:Hit-like protein n=1 Tax=Mycoplasmopsis columbina SF7 TaxID=1037410 RepID=F9UKP2_9BACT|nr:HIT family protein [Mycoplasmopsis columbina]EGV00247.1 hit-like protein [Mycoplasmopsis columbina SF7]VEU77136.1 HIT-family hydrolase protein [Mycoplasmopsis columbina]
MKDLFLKIINRELPSDILYEDDKCIAIYDKYPFREGHFLVIPKKWSQNVTEMDDETAGHVFNVARKLAKKEILDKGIPGFKIIINTGEMADQTVFHTHVHVIPFREKAIIMK